MRRWVSAGQDPAGFWSITPREALVILGGADARDQTELRIRQGLVYAQARLIAVAVNDPRRMPRFEKFFPDPSARKKAQDHDAIWAAMETWAKSTELAKAVTQRTDSQ